MINTEHKGNGIANGGTAVPAHDKQLPGALKKTALRDVQNENVGSLHKQQESLLPAGGRSASDTVKVCGTKRLTPERPSGSPGLPSMAHKGTNENVMNARRRFELELGKGRLQSSVERISDFRQDITHKVPQMRDSNLPHAPVATSNNLIATMAFPCSGPSIPSSLGKHVNVTSGSKVSPTLDPKSTSDQLRTERFIHLQKFLKQCDETSQRDYTQRLLHLSPAELSKHAVELEKKAIQLTIEEGNEMQRMRALNILGKSSPTLVQSNKR